MMAALYSGTADEWCYLGTSVPFQSSLEVDFYIDSFEEHMNKKGSRECLQSHKFTVNGKTMNIDVWPNGSDESTTGVVSVFLTTEPNFVCPECGQKYGKNEEQYNNHIRQQHKFPCKYRPLKFPYVNGLEEHLNSEHSKHIYDTAEANSVGFLCSICNRKFQRIGPYVKHTKRDHNIPCIECDMSFTSDPSLEEHMATVHSINSPTSNKPDVEVSYIVSMGTIEFEVSNTMINPDQPDWGFPRFVSHDKCKFELKNGVFQLKVKVTVKEKKNTLIVGNKKIISKDWPQRSTSKIFEEKSFTDFEIISDGKSYPCHKVFLSAASTVFKGMIESGMKESLNSTLVLESFPEDVINSFLRFIYTGDMDKKVICEHCVIFFELGEKYDMEDLKVVAEQAMISSLNPENMVSFFKAGHMLRGENIKASAKIFICQNIKNVSGKEKLRTELLGESELLMELLESLIGM